MNYSIIRRTTGLVLKFEAIFLLLPALTGFVYRERQGLVYLALAAAYFAIGFLINLKGDTGTEFYTKEGFISVALVWVVISICGALPFVLCGDIPHYSDEIGRAPHLSPAGQWHNRLEDLNPNQKKAYQSPIRQNHYYP